MTPPPDPTKLDAAGLRELVRCPAPRWGTGWLPKPQASPSALQQYAACPRSWGETYLEGRRDVNLEWSYAERIPEPPKAVRGCSALAKVEAEAARRAWKKVRRPSLGHEVHAILAAWMVQNTPGAWRPPMAWREVDWTTTAGKIARPAADVLPDPRGLAGVHSEVAAWPKAPALGRFIEHTLVRDENDEQICCAAGDRPHWPKMAGFYDLITVQCPLEAVGVAGRHVGWIAQRRYHLWDYKSTSSFDWAKTEEELREDPQVLLYALDAMQTFGLQEIECTWIYLRTEGSPAHYAVTVSISRAEAEAAVLEMAETAAEMVGHVEAFKRGRLRVVDLDRNVSACTAYGGCVYHTDKGGPCDARVSPGKALAQRTELDAKITARKTARKESERSMALSFDEKKKAREEKLKAEAAAAAGGTTGETSGQPEPPAAEGQAPVQTASAAATEATTKLRENRPKATRSSGRPENDPDAITVIVNAHEFTVPAGSALGKQLSKLSKAHASVAAALAGE